MTWHTAVLLKEEKQRECARQWEWKQGGVCIEFDKEKRLIKKKDRNHKTTWNVETYVGPKFVPSTKTIHCP